MRIVYNIKSQMLIEQNLFSIYRLITKTPKIVLLTVLAFCIFIAFSQIVYISRINKALDFSSLLLEYRLLKYQQRKALKNSTNDNSTTANISKANDTIINEDISKDYAFLDDTTILEFRFSKQKNDTIRLNYTYDHKSAEVPFMFAVKNQHLVYLHPKTQQYLNKHGIEYDLINIPQQKDFKQPTFAYYFKTNIQTSEFMMSSLRLSYIAHEEKFRLYRIEHNITGTYQDNSQIYVDFSQLHDKQGYTFILKFYKYLMQYLFPQFILKIIYGFEILIILFFASIFMGLFIRYFSFAIYTAFLIVYDRFRAQNYGWVHQYLAVLYRRYQQSGVGTIKIMFFYMIANVGLLLLLAFGSYCILLKMVIPALPLMIDDNPSFFMVTLFIAQIFHFVMSRSRTAIKFFPILSFMTSYTILLICSLNRYVGTLMMMNLNLTLHFILFLVFIMVQKVIVEDGESGLAGNFCPSKSKPRMLFYAGFDITWEKSLPPIWTYFTNWFDYSYFDQSEKCYLEKDYQLLYGRMLGLNERQEIPEVDYELQELPQMPSEPSNEMHLIQQ